MSDKIRIYTFIEAIDTMTSFEEFASRINSLNADLEAGKWTDIETSVENRQGYSDWMYVIHGYRLETDEEYAVRLKQIEETKKFMAKNAKNAKKAREANEKRDRKQYERLKKKFEVK